MRFPTWKEVESDPEFQSLEPTKKKEYFGKWSKTAVDRAMQQGLYRDNDFASGFTGWYNQKAKEYGEEEEFGDFQQLSTRLRQPPKVGTSILGEITQIPSAFKSAIDQPLEAFGETAEVLGAPALAQTLKGAVEAPKDYKTAAESFMRPEKGEFEVAGFAPQYLPRAIVEQAGQLAGAIGTRIAGAAVGGAVGAGVGSVVPVLGTAAGVAGGTAVGAFTGPAVFEMAQIVGPVARERAKNNGRVEPNNEDLAWAWTTAGTSGALNAIGAKYIPGGEKLVGGISKKIAASILGEGLTESGQALAQQTGETILTEKGLTVSPKEAIAEGIIGGAAGGVATAIFERADKKPEDPTKAAATKAAADQLAEANKTALELSANSAPITAKVIQDQAAKDFSAIAETEEAVEEVERFAPPEDAITKQELKTQYAALSPEDLTDTEATFRERLDDEDPEMRTFAQNALDAITEVRAEQERARKLPTDVLPTETPGATYGREADIYDVFADIRRRPMPPSGPAFESAQVIEEAARRADVLRRTPEGRDLLRRELQGEEMVGGVRRATEEALATAPEPAEGDVFAEIRRPSRAEEAAITIEQQLAEDERIRRSQLGAEALREELAQVESLSRVADNTATDEEVVRLARQGLVNIQDGQNVITPRGEEVMQRGGAPLPRLTPEERAAEVAAAPTPAAIVEQVPAPTPTQAPTPVTTPPITEAVTPAPAAPAEAAPVGIAVGDRIKKRKGPTTFIVLEALEPSPSELRTGERSYVARNERTGEVETINTNDRPSVVQGKGAMKSAADIRLEGEVFVPVETENKYTAEEVEDIARDFFGGEIPQNVSIVDDAKGEDFQFKAAFNARTGEIILNRAFLNRNKDNIGTNIAHELGHFIFGDKEVQRTFINFWSSLSKKDKNELNEKLGKMYNNVSSELQLEEAKVSGFTRAIEKYNALPLWYEFVDAIKRVLNRIFNTQFDVSNTEAVAVLASAIKRFKSGERIVREIETGILKNAPEIATPAPEAVVEEAPAERPKRRTKMQNIIDISTGVKRPKTKLTVNEMTALKDQIKMRARRRREDKRSQREFAEELTKEIREMTIRGKVRPAQLRAIMSVALRTQFDNEASINAFNKYADKVIENANYEKDISDALSTIKRAKQLSKGKKGSSRIRHRLAELARFNPRDIEPESMEPKRVEIDGEIVLEKPISVAEYTAVLKEYMGSLGPVTEEGFRVIPEAEIVDFLERMAAQYDANVEERRKAAFAKKIQQALENKALLPSELESLTKDSPEEYEQNLKKKQEDKRLKIENAITDLAMDAQSALVAYQPPEMTADKKEVLDFMRAVNVGDIPAGERKEFVLIANNILVNNDFSGSKKFTSIAKGQIGAMKAAEDAKSVKRNDAMLTFLDGYISEKLTRAINLSIQSIADTFRNIAGKEGAPRLLFLMGMGDLARGQATANKLNDEIANGIRDRYTQIEEETGQQISDKQGMFSMGVAGTLIQIQPDETEAEGISRIRKLILENIAVMENSPLLEDRRNVQFVKKALAEVDADTVDEVLENLNRLHPANYKALDFLMNTVLPEQKETLKEHDELFNNQTDNYNNPFYLPIRYRRTMVPVRTPEDIITSIYGGTPTPKQSANTIKRQKYSALPRDADGAPMLFDFNLTKNVLDSLSSQITAAYTNPYWQQIVSFLKAPPASDAVGGTRNLSFVNERLGKLAQSRTRRAYEMDGVSRILDTVANVSRRLGIGLALGGYGQFIKQLPDQLMTTLVNVKDPQLMSESMADLLSGRANAVLQQFSIGERGEIAGGTTWTNQMEGNFDKVRRFINDGNWVKAADAFERFNNVWLFALKKSDYLAAGSGWLAYYRKYLKDKGAEFNNWDEEAALLQEDNQLRIEAALYAEQMVDMYQGSSDPTKMATLSQRGQNGWENLAKTIFIPFFSFVIQQRSRIFSDARDVAFGDSDQKKSGASGLAGTLLGILAFHTARRFALPAIAGVGASAIYALLGVDMDEPDEEKQKEEANRIWRQFSGEVLSNIFFGGFGDFTEKKFIDSVNYASYLIEAQIGNENVLNDKGELISFDKYQKERSPLYRYTGPGSENNLGMLDIMPGQIGELKKRIEEMTDEELAESLTPEERRVLFVAGLSEWLYTMRLNDADIARMIRRMNKDVIEQAKEREKARKRLQEIYQ